MKPRIFRSSALLVIFLLVFQLPSVHDAQSFHPQEPRPILSSPVQQGQNGTVYLPVMSRCDYFSTPAVIRPRDFPRSSLQGRITIPTYCQTGHTTETPIPTRGPFLNIPAGAYLWVFVYPSNGRYYPQCTDASRGICGTAAAGGEWSVTIYLGRAGVKERFQIVLVEMDKTGSDTLTQKMVAWSKTGIFPGLLASELKPYLIKELDSLQLETAGK